MEAEAKRKKVEKNRKKKAKKKKKLAEKEAAGAEAADSARVATIVAEAPEPEPQPEPELEPQVSEPKPKPDDGTAELRAKFDAGVEQWSAAQVVQWVALQAELLPAGSTQLVTAAFESLGAEETHSSCFFVATSLHTTQSFTQTGSLQRMFYIQKH